MKRRYEVSYYEYGLTKRKSKLFFTGLAAIICYLVVTCRYGEEAYAEISEIDYGKEKLFR